MLSSTLRRIMVKMEKGEQVREGEGEERARETMSQTRC
jgi:hypothetical protein